MDLELLWPSKNEVVLFLLTNSDESSHTDWLRWFFVRHI